MSDVSDTRIGILGYGQVGRAIAKFYNKPLIAELGRTEFEVGMDIMHVCIPYNEDFVGTVCCYYASFEPKVIVIHSTVGVGTTKKINSLIGKKVCVHSPVRGVHPNLYEGIKTFVKYIGYDDLGIGTKVLNHYEEIGIKGELIKDSQTTELGKLLDTTYYGLCIAFHGYANNLCKNLGVNFDKVMTSFNNTYNEGYKELNKNNVIRPVLYAPDGPIGGHCVIPNCKILKGQFGDNELISGILNT